MKQLMILTLFLLSSSIYAGHVEFFDGSAKDAFNKAKTEGKMVFVDFYTSWCGPCKMMNTTTFIDNDLSTYFNDNFISLKINVEHAHPFFESTIKDIKSIPVLAFFDTEKMILKKVVGYQNANQLLTHAKDLSPKAMAVNVKPSVEIPELELRAQADKMGQTFCNELTDLGELTAQYILADDGSSNKIKIESKLEIEIKYISGLMDLLELKYNTELSDPKFLDYFYEYLTKNCEDSLTALQLLTE